MKIMTFNIQSGREFPDDSVINLDFCAEVIKKYNPDFIGLNEVNNGRNHGGNYGNQVKILAEKTGYQYYYFGKAINLFGSDYGNAFMSKVPFTEAETYIVPDPEDKTEDVYYETRGIIKTKLDSGMAVYVTHMGLAKAERQNCVKLLAELIGENPEKTVLMGDFNMIPDDKQLSAIKQWLKDTSEEGKDNFTFPADKPEMKLDYIFVSYDAEVVSSEVIPKIGSDHRAYMAEIEFKQN